MGTWHIKWGPTDVGDKFGTTRPCWGTGDGSEANPFAGLDDPGLSAVTTAGAEIYVRGLMLPRQSPATNITSVGWKPPAGVSGNPTIVRGDYPGEPGIISGLSEYTTTWSGPTDGVWNITFGASNRFTYDYVLCEDTVGSGRYTDYQRLNRVANVSACTTVTGTYYWDAAAFRIYVHPYTSSAPGERIAFPSFGWWLGGNAESNPPTEHVLYYDLTFYSMRWITNYHGRNLEFRQCKALYTPEFIAGDQSSGANQFYDRNDWDTAPGGFYPQGVSGKGNVGLTRNLIRNIGIPDFNKELDSHGLASQHAVNFLAKDNVLTSCGKPFAIWIANTGTALNVTAANNVLRDSHNSGGAIGYVGDGATFVLSFGTANCSPKNVRVENNIFIAPGTQGLHETVVRNKWPASAVEFFGNIIDANNGAEMCYKDAGSAVPGFPPVHNLRSNAMLNPVAQFIHIVTTAAYDGNYLQIVGTASATAWRHGHMISTFDIWKTRSSAHDPDGFYGILLVDHADGATIVVSADQLIE